MQLRRLTRQPTQPLCQQLKSLIKEYLSSRQAPGLNFMQWILSRKGSPSALESISDTTAEPDVYELLAEQSKKTERLLQFVGTEPDSPHALAEETASLLSTLRRL